jgi:translation initiation factor IF-3
MRILERVAEHNAHLAKVEAAPRLDGRNMTMVLAPDKRVQAEWARRQAEEAAEAGGGNGATAPQPDSQPQPAPATTAQE